MWHSGNRVNGHDDVRHVRIFGLAERRRDADIDRVHVGQLAHIGRGAQPAGLDAAGDLVRFDVGDVALTRVDGVGLGLIDVETGDVEPRLRKFHGERQPDVSETDDAHACLLAAYFFEEIQIIFAQRVGMG